MSQRASRRFQKPPDTPGFYYFYFQETSDTLLHLLLPASLATKNQNGFLCKTINIIWQPRFLASNDVKPHSATIFT